MRYRTGLTLAALSLPLFGSQGFAQERHPTRRSLDGTRVGVSYASGRRELGVAGGRRLNPWISQFGWHEEQEVIASAEGPSILLQQVVLVGGVEQGAFVPTATALIGLRTAEGFDFGVGPNLSFEGWAVAVALGQRLDVRGVRIPINVALVHGHSGTRATFLVGFPVKSSRS